MIDQTKDKKDDALKQKLDKDKKEPRKEDAQKTVEAQPKDSLAVADKQKTDKAKAPQAGSNNARAVQPIGSANVKENEAEIHSEPNKSGQKLGTLKASSKVDILGRQGDELKVMVNGKVGYISAKATDIDGKAEAPKVAPKPIGTVTVTAAALNVRKGAGLDQASMGVLNQADKVKIYGEKNGFLEIRVGDQTGYIKAEYTDFEGQKTAAKPKENPKAEKAIDQAPQELKDLLAKENMTDAEIAQAREMINHCPVALRGDLYQTLQTKPAYVASQKDKKKNPLADKQGAGLENLAACLSLLGIHNPTDMPFETYLEQVRRDQKLPGEESMESWGSVANAMGVSYKALSLPGDRQPFDKKFWSEVVREQLRQGNAIMACVQNQTVRVEAIDDKGLVLTLPENAMGITGLGDGWKSYSGKADQKSNGKRGLLSFDAISQAGLQWVVSMS